MGRATRRGIPPAARCPDERIGTRVFYLSWHVSLQRSRLERARWNQGWLLRGQGLRIAAEKTRTTPLPGRATRPPIAPFCRRSQDAVQQGAAGPRADGARTIVLQCLTQRIQLVELGGAHELPTSIELGVWFADGLPASFRGRGLLRRWRCKRRRRLGNGRRE